MARPLKIILLMIFIFMVSTLQAQLNSPEEFKQGTSVIARYESNLSLFWRMKSNQNIDHEKPISFFGIPIYWSIRLYQNSFSRLNGMACPMTPSCSHYGLEAVKKHKGLGLLMTTDRLLRCGHDLHLYKKVRVDNRIRFSDPVRE